MAPTDTETPTGGAPATVDTGSPTGQQPTQQQPAATTQQPAVTTAEPPKTTDFAVPDAYKDKGWAGKVKSLDDVYKALDGAQELIGKKTISPIDYSTATPEDIAAYHSKLAPEDATAYSFSADGDPTMNSKVSTLFQKLGINEYQGKALAAEVPAIAAEIHAAMQSQNVSAEGYLSLAKERFGEGHDKIGTVIDATIKQNATEADLAVFDAMDNNTRIAVDQTIYNMSKGYEDRIAKILKEHGVTETGAQGGQGQGQHTNDAAAKRAEIRGQMRELEGKPHTQQQKDALQQQLNALIGK